MELELIAVTGASGFIGTHLTRTLLEQNRAVISVSRAASASMPHVFNTDLSQPDMGDRLDCVVHLAGRAHVTSNDSLQSAALFQAANVQYLMDVARASAKKGARRFIYASSIGVLGEETKDGLPFTRSSFACPCSQYSRSKLDGEYRLKEICAETGMEYVIIRPPLVYGAGARGNFAAMVKWLQHGVPLPLASINNRRSFISVGNLIDLIIRTIEHPDAANSCFLAADGEDLSTPDFIRRTARAMGKNARLFGVPEGVLKAAFNCTGKSKLTKRLISSLEIDISDTRKLLQWSPPFTIEAGLRSAVGER